MVPPVSDMFASFRELIIIQFFFCIVFDERSLNMCCRCTLEISRAFDSRTLEHDRILHVFSVLRSMKVASTAIFSQLYDHKKLFSLQSGQ